MNTTYDLSKFFATATFEERTKVLLEICKRDALMLLQVINAVSQPTTWAQEVEPLLRNSRKIEAIKICRARTGWALKDSKDAVESLQKELGL